MKYIVWVDSPNSKTGVQLPGMYRQDGNIYVHSPEESVENLRDANDRLGEHERSIGAWKYAEIVTCDAGDMNSTVDLLTKSNPGREIYVAQINQVFSRAVGDIIEKKVSEAGVLPF
jgi:hypothetical protein